MQTQTKQKTCAELISARYVDRAKQFSELEDQCCNETLNHENYGEWSRCFNESILAFDFVEANTFDNQPDGYHRLQLSWVALVTRLGTTPKMSTRNSIR